MIKESMYRRSQRFASVFLALAGSILFAFILAGCSMSINVVFANGMGHSVVVTYKNDQHRTVEVDVAPNATVEITDLLNTHFSINTAQSALFYERTDVPSQYVYDKGFGPYFKFKVKAQLEPDGCIYLYGEKDELLTQKPPAQPPNFPLCGRAHVN